MYPLLYSVYTNKLVGKSRFCSPPSPPLHEITRFSNHFSPFLDEKKLKHINNDERMIDQV